MPKLFLLSGTSGVGKTTIAYRLLEEMPNLARLVTYISREPRPNEKNGEDYHFISRQEFENKIANGEMFEYDEHYGNYYGNSKEDLEKIWKQNKIALILLDINGVKTIKKTFPEAKTIFITPDNLENLKRRIRQRPMTDEAFAKRCEQIEKELQESAKFDFIITNNEGELDSTVKKVKEILNG